VQLDPLAGPVQQILGVVLWSGGKLDEAAAVFRAGLARNPSYRPIQMSLFALYLLSGRPDEAAEVLRAAHDTSALNRMLIEAKRDPAARRTLLAGFGKFTHGLSAFDRGRLYAILGERERCLAELEAALRNRDPRLEFIKTDPTWPTIRDDPRFIRIVKQMGLPP
jgi:tetratricopeptide (TPR) repeat protein